MRDRVRRAAQADRRLARCGDLGDPVPAPHDDGQRPRPERRDEPLGKRRQLGEDLGAGPIGDVDDQRVARGATLASEDPRDRGIVVGARAEAVHGLRREGDELAGGKLVCGCADRGGVVCVEKHGLKGSRYRG